ncbi:MAG: hypothetical protein WD118_08980 [Phycisphaeraceae bacterium]
MAVRPSVGTERHGAGDDRRLITRVTFGCGIGIGCVWHRIDCIAVRIRQDMVELVDAAMGVSAVSGVGIVSPPAFDIHEVVSPRAVGELVHHVERQLPFVRQWRDVGGHAASPMLRQP